MGMGVGVGLGVGVGTAVAVAVAVGVGLASAKETMGKYASEPSPVGGGYAASVASVVGVRVAVAVWLSDAGEGDADAAVCADVGTAVTILTSIVGETIGVEGLGWGCVQAVTAVNSSNKPHPHREHNNRN